MNARNPIKTYTREAIMAALQAAGIPARPAGREIEADIHGTGHHSAKIAPHKGVYLDASTGTGGTVAALLRRVGAPRVKGTEAPASPAEGGTRTQTDKAAAAKAQRIWNQAWTCTHEHDMPAGWDHGIVTREKMGLRARLEQERDAVIAYLRSRGLGDVAFLRQVRIAREKDGAIMMLTPMYSAGTICGIQRTYLTSTGKKIRRKMLGKHGTCRVTPPGCPRLVIGQVLAEGFETCGTGFVLGVPGLVGYDAGGIKRVADDAPILTAEQRATMGMVLVMVDDDESGTGQAVALYAVHTLRRKGFDARYCLPPETVKGGPKGRDWNDALRELGPDATAAALLLAAEAPFPPMPEDQKDSRFTGTSSGPTAIWPVSKALTPRTVNLTMQVEEARARMAQVSDEFLQKCIAWHKGQTDKDAPFATPPIIGLEITTGTGKTREIKRIVQQLRKRGIPSLVVAKDKAAAQAYEESGIFWRHGRSAEDEPWSTTYYCPHAREGGNVERLADARHPLAEAMCSSGHCVHGNVRALKIAKEQETQPSESVLHFFAVRPEAQDEQPCVWFDHLATSTRALSVVVTAAGLSEADLI